MIGRGHADEQKHVLCATTVRSGYGAEQDYGGHEERARLRNAQENRRALGRSQAGRSGDRSKFSRKPYGFFSSIEPRCVLFFIMYS